MYGIDRYAWSNAIVDIDPLPKACLACAAIVLCLLLNDIAVSAATVLWIAGATVLWARIPLRAVLRLMTAEIFFLCLSIAGIVITVGAAPVGPVWFAFPLGSMWVYTSHTAVILAGELLMRALACATAMGFLALTTPLTDLIELLRRLHTPGLVIDLMMISYRSIFVLLESVERTYTAQNSRLGYASTVRALVSASGLGGRIFLETMLRNQRLAFALESRGYVGGALQVLPTTYRRTRLPWLGAALMSATLLSVYLYR